VAEGEIETDNEREREGVLSKSHMWEIGTEGTMIPESVRER